MWNIVNQVIRYLGDKDGTRGYDKTTDSLEAQRDNMDVIRGADSDTLETLSDQIDLITVENISTTTGTIIQDGATGTPNVVQITPSATANTFGAWTELDASTEAKVFLSHVSITANAVDAGYLCVEIGTGANPNEAAIARFSFAFVNLATYSAFRPIVYSIPVPLEIAASTRVSARASFSDASYTGYVYVGISYLTGV